MKKYILLKDPLYKRIDFEENLKWILDSKYFQRLRYIRQTSFAYSVYPNANHSRFTHSLGTYFLMKKVVEGNNFNFTEEEKNNLKIAAMLHDIGHGPFSHVWESIFPHFDHEKETIKILKKLGLNGAIDIIKKKKPYSQLLSSTLDVDKLDYMARDSYFAGVSYGVMEVDFILDNLSIIDEKLVINPSSISSVEDLITQRYNLFKTVYLHKISLMMDFIFISIFRRVKSLWENKKLEIENPDLLSFFKKENDLENLLNLTDDVVLAMIRNWSRNEDKILSDLANKFIYRNKFNIINLDFYDVDLNSIKKKIKEKGYDLNYYYKEYELSINIIQTRIYVNFGDNNIKPLEEVSKLISYYQKLNPKVRFVIFPEDIRID